MIFDNFQKFNLILSAFSCPVKSNSRVKKGHIEQGKMCEFDRNTNWQLRSIFVS